jgi:exopolysaccharide biosynthesis polyprenyl glycosylphosphotransferase
VLEHVGETPLASPSAMTRGVGATYWLVLLVSAVDVAAIAACGFLVTNGGDRTARDVAVFVGLLGLVWLPLAQLQGLYRRDQISGLDLDLDYHVRVGQCLALMLVVFAGLGGWTGVASLSGTMLLIFWIMSVVVLIVGRTLLAALLGRRNPTCDVAVIVGAGKVGQLIARKLVRNPKIGIAVAGFVDANPRETDLQSSTLPVLGSPAELTSVIASYGVNRIIVAFSEESDQDLLSVIDAAIEREVRVDIVPRFFEEVGPGAGLGSKLEGLSLVTLPLRQPSRPTFVVKRALDVGLSAIALILLAPVLACIAVGIKLDSTGPVFYMHERVGKGRRLFRLLKFRTMYLEHCQGDQYGGKDAERAFGELLRNPGLSLQFETNQKLDNDPRVTRFGRFLRRVSFDELPQFVNVLRGDMSIVGPRPVTAEELYHYGTDVDRLLTIRPGITGYWQVNGRSRLTYEERVALDLLYTRGWSLALDLRILVRTLGCLSEATFNLTPRGTPARAGSFTPHVRRAASHDPQPSADLGAPPS